MKFQSADCEEILILGETFIIWVENRDKLLELGRSWRNIKRTAFTQSALSNFAHSSLGAAIDRRKGTGGGTKEGKYIIALRKSPIGRTFSFSPFLSLFFSAKSSNASFISFSSSLVILFSLASLDCLCLGADAAGEPARRFAG